MSMLSHQADELRETAERLDRIADVSTPWIHAKLTPMLREAADTIISLRDRMQKASEGCEYCKGGNGFDGQTAMMSNHGWQTIRHCPNCGRKVVDE